MSKPWPFQKLVFISPSAPALDLAEELDEPAAAPKGERCWLCLGRGTTGKGSHEYGWEKCPCCKGAGTVGGAA